MTAGGNRGELPAHLRPRAGPHPGHDDRPEHDSRPSGRRRRMPNPGQPLESAPGRAGSCPTISARRRPSGPRGRGKPLRDAAAP